MSRSFRETYSFRDGVTPPANELEVLVQGEPPPVAKTKVVCTLGPASREVPILEKLLRAGEQARFSEFLTGFLPVLFGQGGSYRHAAKCQNIGFKQF